MLILGKEMLTSRIASARKPECWNCMQVDLCDYRAKTPAPAGI